jgi:hypothetical protein
MVPLPENDAAVGFHAVVESCLGLENILHNHIRFLQALLHIPPLVHVWFPSPQVSSGLDLGSIGSQGFLSVEDEGENLVFHGNLL